MRRWYALFLVEERELWALENGTNSAVCIKGGNSRLGSNKINQQPTLSLPSQRNLSRQSFTPTIVFNTALG
jgi:hypothetical protein